MISIDPAHIHTEQVKIVVGQAEELLKDPRDVEIARLKAELEAVKVAARAVLEALPKCTVDLDSGCTVDSGDTEANCCTEMASHWALDDDPMAVDGVPCCESHRSIWLKKPDFPHAAPAAILAKLVAP